MWVIQVIVAAFFLVLGLIFLSGKGAFLISGYNTMPKEARDKYDAVAMCKFMGKSMLGYCGCMLITATVDFFDSMIPMLIGWGLFGGLTVFMLVYMNTGNRFRK